jgi:hypothetical protein
MSQSPEKPWVRGKHPTHTAFRVTINICQDSDGNVWSDHDFATDEDVALCKGLPQGGAPQVAHALLTEAVRREAFMCALIELTKDPSYLLRFKAGESPVVDELAAATEQVIARTLGKMTPGAAAEVLAMMAAQG